MTADKRQDFLWIVQTALTVYGKEAVGFLGVAGDAIAASYRIPADMTARDAALDFIGFMFTNLRDQARANGETTECPDWFANLADPVPSMYETRGLRSI